MDDDDGGGAGSRRRSSSSGGDVIMLLSSWNSWTTPATDPPPPPPPPPPLQSSPTTPRRAAADDHREPPPPPPYGGDDLITGDDVTHLPAPPPAAARAVRVRAIRVGVRRVVSFGLDFDGVPAPAAATASSAAWAACLPETTVDEGDGIIGECCAVCLEEYEAGDAVRTLPCAHGFHERCIFRWLGVRRLCPLCRFALALPPPASAAA